MGATPSGGLDDEEPTPVPDVAAPIQTVTMADLFVQQGHAVKAVPIYEHLLSEDPGNVSLREKLIAARRASSPSPDAGIVPPAGRTTDDEPTEPPLGAAPMSWDTVPDFDASELAASAPPASESQLDFDPAPPAAAFAFAPAGTPAEILRSSLDKIRARRRAPSSAPALAGKEP